MHGYIYYKCTCLCIATSTTHLCINKSYINHYNTTSKNSTSVTINSSIINCIMCYMSVIKNYLEAVTLDWALVYDVIPGHLFAHFICYSVRTAVILAGPSFILLELDRAIFWAMLSFIVFGRAIYLRWLSFVVCGGAIFLKRLSFKVFSLAGPSF